MELSGSNFQVVDDYAWRRNVYNEDVDASVYTSSGSELAIAYSDRALLLDQSGAGYEIRVLDNTISPPVLGLANVFDTPPPRRVVCTSGSFTYLAGVHYGVPVRDAAAFRSAAFMDKAAGWMPLDESPLAPLLVVEHSPYSGGTQNSAVEPEDRVWDADRGWVLQLSPRSGPYAQGAVFTYAVDRALDALWTFSFWVKSGGGYETGFLRYGPLRVDLANTTLLVYGEDSGGTPQVLATASLTANVFTYVTLSYDGIMFRLGTGTLSAAITQTSTTCHIRPFEALVAQKDTFSSSGLVNWSVTLSSSQVSMVQGFDVRTASADAFGAGYDQTDDLSTAGAASNVFTASVPGRVGGSVSLNFGDGVHGTIPPAGFTLSVRYYSDDTLLVAGAQSSVILLSDLRFWRGVKTVAEHESVKIPAAKALTLPVIPTALYDSQENPYYLSAKSSGRLFAAEGEPLLVVYQIQYGTQLGYNDTLVGVAAFGSPTRIDVDHLTGAPAVVVGSVLFINGATYTVTFRQIFGPSNPPDHDVFYQLTVAEPVDPAINGYNMYLRQNVYTVTVGSYVPSYYPLNPDEPQYLQRYNAFGEYLGDSAYEVTGLGGGGAVSNSYGTYPLGMQGREVAGHGEFVFAGSSAYPTGTLARESEVNPFVRRIYLPEQGGPSVYRATLAVEGTRVVLRPSVVYDTRHAGAITDLPNVPTDRVFTFQGAYQSSHAYAINDLVTFASKYYGYGSNPAIQPDPPAAPWVHYYPLSALAQADTVADAVAYLSGPSGLLTVQQGTLAIDTGYLPRSTPVQLGVVNNFDNFTESWIAFDHLIGMPMVEAGSVIQVKGATYNVVSVINTAPLDPTTADFYQKVFTAELPDNALNNKPVYILLGDAAYMYLVDRDVVVVPDATLRWIAAEVTDDTLPTLRAAGDLVFLNPEPLEAGNYRLTLDCGNEGLPDPKFKGFDVEVVIGHTDPATTFQAVLLPDAGDNSRGVQSFSLALADAIPCAWVLRLHWRNDRANDGNYQRVLQVHGYTLTKIVTEPYAVRSNSTTYPALAYPVLGTSPNDYYPGGWVGWMNSYGSVASWHHESTIFNDYSAYPTALLLAGVTSRRTEDLSPYATYLPSRVRGGTLPANTITSSTGSYPYGQSGTLTNLTLTVPGSGSIARWAWIFDDGEVQTGSYAQKAFWQGGVRRATAYGVNDDGWSGSFAYAGTFAQTGSINQLYVSGDDIAVPFTATGTGIYTMPTTGPHWRSWYMDGTLMSIGSYSGYRNYSGTIDVPVASAGQHLLALRILRSDVAYDFPAYAEHDNYVYGRINLPPVLSPIVPDPLKPLLGSTPLKLTVQATDPDPFPNGVLSFSWAMYPSENAAGDTIGVTQFDTNFSGSSAQSTLSVDSSMVDAGELYTFIVTCVDGKGATATGQYSLVFGENAAPVITDIRPFGIVYLYASRAMFKQARDTTGASLGLVLIDAYEPLRVITWNDTAVAYSANTKYTLQKSSGELVDVEVGNLHNRVAEGYSVIYEAKAYDPEGEAVAYDWRLDQLISGQSARHTYNTGPVASIFSSTGSVTGTITATDRLGRTTTLDVPSTVVRPQLFPPIIRPAGGSVGKVSAVEATLRASGTTWAATALPVNVKFTRGANPPDPTPFYGEDYSFAEGSYNKVEISVPNNVDGGIFGQRVTLYDGIEGNDSSIPVVVYFSDSSLDVVIDVSPPEGGRTVPIYLFGNGQLSAQVAQQIARAFSIDPGFNVTGVNYSLTQTSSVTLQSRHFGARVAPSVDAGSGTLPITAAVLNTGDFTAPTSVEIPIGQRIKAVAFTDPKLDLYVESIVAEARYTS